MWHLIVTQGVVYGIGSSFLYVPTLSYMNEWFVQRRGLAYGIMFGGTGFSGLVLPIMFSKLLNRVGLAMTLRIWAYLMVRCHSVRWHGRSCMLGSIYCTRSIFLDKRKNSCNPGVPCKTNEPVLLQRAFFSVNRIFQSFSRGGIFYSWNLSTIIRFRPLNVFPPIHSGSFSPKPDISSWSNHIGPHSGSLGFISTPILVNACGVSKCQSHLGIQ